MSGTKSDDIPITRITRDEFDAIGRGQQKEASKAEAKKLKAEDKKLQAERKEAEKELRKPAGGSGLSRLFGRSRSRGKTEDSLDGPSSLEAKKPPGLTVNVDAPEGDDSRLRPGTALSTERAPSTRSSASIRSRSPALVPGDRPRTPKSPGSSSLWERPTRSRDGDPESGKR